MNVLTVERFKEKVLKKYANMYNENNFLTNIENFTFVIMSETAKFDE